jgi:hypothetical protein
MYCPHLQGQRSGKLAACILPTTCPAYPLALKMEEIHSSKNVEVLPDNTASHPRRSYSFSKKVTGPENRLSL